MHSERGVEYYRVHERAANDETCREGWASMRGGGLSPPGSRLARPPASGPRPPARGARPRGGSPAGPAPPGGSPPGRTSRRGWAWARRGWPAGGAGRELVGRGMRLAVGGAASGDAGRGTPAAREPTLALAFLLTGVAATGLAGGGVGSALRPLPQAALMLTALLGLSARAGPILVGLDMRRSVACMVLRATVGATSRAAMREPTESGRGRRDPTNRLLPGAAGQARNRRRGLFANY